MRDPGRELTRIIGNRQRRERDLGVNHLVDRIDQSARRTNKRIGQIVSIWEAVIPPEIAVHTRIAGLRGGILDIIADSAPIRYELDVHLRGGGEHAIRRMYPGTLRRIRVRLGTLTD